MNKELQKINQREKERTIRAKNRKEKSCKERIASRNKIIEKLRSQLRENKRVADKKRGKAVRKLSKEEFADKKIGDILGISRQWANKLNKENQK